MRTRYDSQIKPGTGVFRRFSLGNGFARLAFAVVAWTMAACVGPVARAVDFPGPQPGPATGADSDGFFTLENAVMASSWGLADGSLQPVAIVNKLTRNRLDQSGTELFRLATVQAGAMPTGMVVAIRLTAETVFALASRDGVAWTELASFPRTDFAGTPLLVRIGKMDLKAQSCDHGNGLGVDGEALLSHITPRPPSLPSGRFFLKAKAHQARTVEYAFPAGTDIVSCRIDKGSDQGMSWAPALALVWEDGRRFVLVGLREKTPVFNVTTSSGERIMGARLGEYPVFDRVASDFRVETPPRFTRLPSGGMGIEAVLTSDGGIRAGWRAELRDGANYIRQVLDLSAPATNVPLHGVELGDVRVPDVETIGACPGSPAAGSGMFFGVEMPGAQNAIGVDGVRIGFTCRLSLTPGQSYSFGGVTGIAPAGQRRRAFLCYVERERARPARPFLHYNCWYDLGYDVNASNILDVVRRFDDELVRKRGVRVQSYLVDDGWDDVRAGLWVENLRKFPGGLRALKGKMDPFDAHLGIWISPLGGYGGARERTEFARALGLIPSDVGLDLAHPPYRTWFRERCRELMREAGVNAFKWDRAGEGVSPHFMALLDIANSLRKENPDVFINVTVGTWPSPFWLNHVDSTWRDGSSDVGWAGRGDDREQWLTFRDGYCRKLFVEKAPLYPLNAVMHHGVVHGRCFQGDKVGKSGTDLKHEARSYFASGAMLQELYLTPSMMTPEAWDIVAAAARWAHTNADVLIDAHWVGGDPLKLEAYGYAAWNRRKGTVMLRNPDDGPQTMALDAALVFELPVGAATRYTLTSPYRDQRIQSLELEAGKEQLVTLEPFEVCVFDALP